jgi:thioredoxin reductase (NADPH)
MTPPAAVLLVVGGDSRDVQTTASALKRRFGSDYRILTAGSATDGLAELTALAGGEQVALVAADLHLPDGDGVEFLERAAGLHNGVARLLLFDPDDFHTSMPFRELPALQRASALGRIDGWLVKGWVNPEEALYPQVQAALSAWSKAHQPRHLVYRMIGAQWDGHSHDLRDALTVNGVPFEFHTNDSDSGRRLARDHGVDLTRLPALLRHDGTVLQQPSMAEIALSHGVQIRPTAPAYDLVVIGAGPAGLAAAVYGASEGLTTLVVEARAIGGQAGTSSMIRNYLGFQHGISGGELAQRAWQQATLLGAEFIFTNRATALTAKCGRHVITLDDGTEVAGRAVILAAGVTYRHLIVAELDRLVGAGVFYGAAGVVAPAIAGEDVFVVGGANSAGQAALHLAKQAAHVTLLLRGASLAAGMSDYLVQQIQATRNLDVRLHTQVVGGHGDSRLESLTLEDDQGQQEKVPAAAVFIMIGAKPHADWLAPTLSLDKDGFVLTGQDLPGRVWELERAPYPFETSHAGVFAAGDLRHGSLKRVAGAVGEGSVAVGSVHRYLAAQPASRTDHVMTAPTSVDVARRSEPVR